MKTTRSGLPKRAVVEDIPEDFYDYGRSVDAANRTDLQEAQHMLGHAVATGNRQMVAEIAKGNLPPEMGKLVIGHVLTSEQHELVAKLYQQLAAAGARYLERMDAPAPADQVPRSERLRSSGIGGAAGAVQRAKEAATRTAPDGPPAWPPTPSHLTQELTSAKPDDLTVALPSPFTAAPNSGDTVVIDPELTQQLPTPAAQLLEETQRIHLRPA